MAGSNESPPYRFVRTDFIITWNYNTNIECSSYYSAIIIIVLNVENYCAVKIFLGMAGSNRLSKCRSKNLTDSLVLCFYHFSRFIKTKTMLIFNYVKFGY